MSPFARPYARLLACPAARAPAWLAASCALVLAACGKPTESESIQAAQALLAKDDLAGAAIELKSVLGEHPDSADARLLLGKALLKAGDPAAALIELRKVDSSPALEAQLLPELARAQLLLGDYASVLSQYGKVKLADPVASADLKTTVASAHAAQGNAAEATQAAEAALQMQPGYAPALVVLARMDATQGRGEEALRRLDALLATSAWPEAAGLLKADILLQAKGPPQAALAAYRQVLTAYPRSVAARAGIINQLVDERKGAEARREFEDLRKEAPRHPDTLFLQAQFAFADGDYKGSREIHDKLLTTMPENPRVLLSAGLAEYQMQHYSLAAGFLGRAVKVAPQQLLARQMLAQSYLKMALPEKAGEVLQPVVEQAGADAASLSLAAEAQLQAGDAKRSEALFKRAAQVAPEAARTRAAMAQLQLTQAQSAQGNLGPAVAELQNLATTKPDSQADLALLNLRLRQNDYKAALLVIDGLEKKRPNEPVAFVFRGRVLMSQGDTAGAGVNFEKALQKVPHHLPALDGLAALDMLAGKPDQARQRFQAVVKAQPKNVRARVSLAELEGRLGAPDAVVVTQLKEAAAIDPLDPTPRLALVERLLASGERAAARAAAQDAVAALPDNLVVLDALGRTQLASGDSTGAAITFSRLAAQQPRNPQHQVRLAEAARIAGDRATATRSLKKALELQPDDLPAQRAMALLALEDKRPQDGVAIARGLQKRLPKDAAGFALEGEVEAGARNWAAAATAYAAALERTKSSELALRLHRSLREAGKTADADRWAAKWMAAEPKDATFVYYLGTVAMAAQDWPQAESRLRAALALQPRHALATNNLAWVLATQRKPGAVAMAEQANALMPDRPALLDTLAMAQDVEDQLSKAVDTQKRAVALDPRDPALRLRLARLLVKQGEKSAARTQLDALAKLGPSFAGQAEVAELIKAL